MKRIVILSAFLSPFRSGAEACAEEVPLQLVDQFNFTIVTARLRRDLPKNDILRIGAPTPGPSPTGGGERKVKVIRIGLGCSFDKWLFPFLAPFVVRKLKPNVIHGILETFAGLALYFCRFTYPKAKRILTLQTTNRSFLKGMIVRSPDRVTAISNHLKGIAEDLGRKDIVVIPNGIDYAAIRSACAKHAKVPGRILFVGRLEKMKGVDLLLKAFAQLQAANCKLHIVGDGSQRSALENLARQLDIADQVVFKGYLQSSEVNREYAEAEIFSGISRSEALGNVFLEALAAGCAVIGTNIGGIVEIVQSGAAAILVKPEVSAVVGALKKVLDMDVRKHFAGENQQASQKYDWKLIANQYAQVYKSA